MWVKKEEYEFLKDRALRLENARTWYASDLEIYRMQNKMNEQKCDRISKELYEIKKDLEYYLSTNEEKGVVRIPKFVIEKIVYGT